MINAQFKSYRDGYFFFEFETGEDMAFDQVHPKILYRYNLKEDESLIDAMFLLTFSEHVEDDDSVIYRIESLKPLE
ncbi:MAG: hypothetical protein HKO90_08110 [Flavobacteriaceae bacterium]|nr:hypothetical protein [Bacteroidia bacterium]NNK88231.1 hypothetical protein [Flavobacteriaceae bacterium]